MGFFFHSREPAISSLNKAKSQEGGRHMKRFLFLMFILVVTSSAVAEEKRFTIPLGDSPTMGPADAPVTIVEFIDFQ
jgi:protein-disulfide isomerase